MTKLNRGDWLLTIMYLLVNVSIYLIYRFEILNRDFVKNYYFIVGLLSFFLVFDYFNKRFRKTGMLIIWAVIGGLQFILYYYYKDVPELQAVNGNYISWLKAVPITIIVLVVFNFINKKLYGDYFIVTMLRINSKEKIDERELRPADYMFSFLGFLIVIFSVVI